MDWIQEHAWAAWLGAAALLAVAELFSLDLVLLMFALGALAAAVASALGAPFWLCMIVAAVVSVGLLLAVRPTILRKLHQGPTLPVGQHGLVGTLAIVDEPVSALGGRVNIEGLLWTARPVDSTQTYDVGTELVVTAIDGATALVARKEG